MKHHSQDQSKLRPVSLRSHEIIRNRNPCMEAPGPFSYPEEPMDTDVSRG